MKADSWTNRVASVSLGLQDEWFIERKDLYHDLLAETAFFGDYIFFYFEGLD